MQIWKSNLFQQMKENSMKCAFYGWKELSIKKDCNNNMHIQHISRLCAIFSEHIYRRYCKSMKSISKIDLLFSEI